MSLPVNPTTGQAPPVPSGGGRMKTSGEGEPVDVGFAFLLAALIGPVNPPGAGPAAPQQGAGAALSDALAAVPSPGGKMPAGWQGALAQGGLNQAIPNLAAANPAVEQSPAEALPDPGAAPAEGEAQPAVQPAVLPADPTVDPPVPPEAVGMTAPADDAAPRPPQGNPHEMPAAEAPAAPPEELQPAASPEARQGDVPPQAGGDEAGGGGSPAVEGDLAGVQLIRREAARPEQAGAAPASGRPESPPVGERPLPPALESLRAERHEPARLMESIARSVRSSPDGEYTVTLRLYPEDLGEVRLELRLSGRSVTALMEVTTPEARQALEARSDVLRQNLEGAGFTLSGFEVATGQQQQSAWERWQALEAELTRRSLLGARPAGIPSGPAAGAAERVRGVDRHTGRLDTKA